MASTKLRFEFIVRYETGVYNHLTLEHNIVSAILDDVEMPFIERVHSFPALDFKNDETMAAAFYAWRDKMEEKGQREWNKDPNHKGTIALLLCSGSNTRKAYEFMSEEQIQEIDNRAIFGE